MSATANDEKTSFTLLTAPITSIAEQMSMMLGRPDARMAAEDIRDVVDRLVAYDVTYLTGGSADASAVSLYSGPDDVDPVGLVRDLAQAPNARLRDALIALLLRHPEFSAMVRTVFASMQTDDPARRPLLARLLAAAALQRMGDGALSRTRIDVSDLVSALDLPAPDVEEGDALLKGAAELLTGPYPIDWIDGWMDVLRHTLAEAKRESAA